MSSDRARRSYDAGRMYRSVVSQQGRVALEADANEAEEIRAWESRAELIDIIGPNGAPNRGFKISAPPTGTGAFDFAIGHGALYVGGVRAYNPHAGATYLKQKDNEWVDYPDGRVAAYPSGNQARTEAIYLTLAEKEVSAVEDPALREAALGGPDTSARTRLIQRVQRLTVESGNCDDAFAEVVQKAEAKGMAFVPETMRLESSTRLRVDFVPTSVEADACQPTAQAGFLGSENQLIRVQVYDANNLMWGWDNASFLYRVTIAGARLVKLQGVPVDVYHQPRANQWVEVLETAVELDGEARVAAPVGRLIRVIGYDPTDRTVTLADDVPTELLPPTATIAPVPIFSPPIPIASPILGGPSLGPALELIPGPIPGPIPEPTPAPIPGFPGPIVPPARTVFLRVWEKKFPIPASDTVATELIDANNVGTGVRIFVKKAVPVPGDHWLIGVRPSTPDAILPARLATFQPPDGPNRWMAPLAMIFWSPNKKIAHIADCRPRFRPLTDQGADLDFHNKHLHGWGVVCGLQVQCMTTEYDAAHNLDKEREWVLVRDGYAIHPTGSDIWLRSFAGDGVTALHLGNLAVAEAGFTRTDGVISDGAVSLWIGKHGKFHVDPYDPDQKRGWQDLLQGTILVDIYNHCILPLIEFFKSQLAAGVTDPVGPAAKRLTALLNLFWQLVNQTSGPHIYLSGETDPATQPADKEDAILRALFNGTKQLLQGTTFCAMFDDADYPEYKLYRSGLPDNAPHPTTIFGPGIFDTARHTRIRIQPAGKWAFTCGAGGKLNVYDLGKKKLVAQVDFPDAGAEIQDVAFAPAGNDRDIYVVALVGASKVDSVFRMATVDDQGAVTWTGVKVDCSGLRLISLATSTAAPGAVFAAARGRGIYKLGPGGGAPAQVSTTFRATGHLVAGEREGHPILYAGAHDSETNPVAFDHLHVVDFAMLDQPVRFDLQQAGEAQRTGHDDLAVMRPLASTSDEVYAIIDGPNQTKRLVVWRIISYAVVQPEFEFIIIPGATAALAPVRDVDLGASMGNRIAFGSDPRWAMITYQDTSIGRVYFTEQGELANELHPLQIGPTAIAADVDGGWFYVLNYVSNTITAIPANADDAEPWRSTIDMTALETYRREALTVYLKVLGRFAQYLKDCFCEQLLVNCPDATGKKVYLADVSFKDGKIYQICNFHHRKYVHTFPTVEYWMSLVPVIPMIKFAVEKVCCSVLTGIFDKYLPGDPAIEKKADMVSATVIQNAGSYVRAADLKQQAATTRSGLGSLGTLAKAALVSKLSQPPAGNDTAKTGSNEVVDMIAPEATKIAVAKGLTVRNVEVVSFSSALAMVVRPTVASGETVDLITDSSGKVLGWKRVSGETSGGTPGAAAPGAPSAAGTPERAPGAAAPAPGATAPAPAAAPAPATEEIAVLRTQLAEMHTRLVKMDEELTLLRKPPTG